MTVRRAGRGLLELEISDDTTYDLVRDVVVELGVGLVRLQRGRRHMLDMFRDPGAAGPAGAGMTTPRETGAIHDIGYRQYDGPRLGPAYIRRSLTVQSLRGAYGLGSQRAVQGDAAAAARGDDRARR